jgi:hypothetical protein
MATKQVPKKKSKDNLKFKYVFPVIFDDFDWRNMENFIGSIRKNIIEAVSDFRDNFLNKQWFLDMEENAALLHLIDPDVNMCADYNEYFSDEFLKYYLDNAITSKLVFDNLFIINDGSYEMVNSEIRLSVIFTEHVNRVVDFRKVSKENFCAADKENCYKAETKLVDDVIKECNK